MHRSVLTIAALTLLAAGCEPGPVAPELQPSAPSLARNDERPDHENYRAPFARSVANPCPPVPEPVAVEGYLHYNAHFKFFDGGNQSRLMSNSHGSGVGAVTGVKYQFRELWTLRGRYTYANSTWQTEQSTRFHVISQTGLGNFFSTVTMRIVYAPEGIQTEVIAVETDCRG